MIATAACAAALCGCVKTDDSVLRGPESANVLSVRFETEGMGSGRSAYVSIDDSAIESVTAYRFTEGILQEILPGDGLEGGTCTFHPTELSGSMHFVANGDGLFDALRPGESTFEEFRHVEAATAAMTDGRMAMSGSMEISSATSPATSVRMRRTVARIDISSTESGVEVLGVTVRNIFDRGYVIGGASPATPDTASQVDFTADFSGSPLANGSRTLLYTCEQANAEATAEVVASFGGGLHRMSARLPSSIRRNHTYTLRVRGAGADMTVEVSADGWDEGESADAAPSPKGLVDAEASTLPDGVRLAESRDSVHVSHVGASFRLVLLAEAGSDIDIEGSVRGAEVETERQTRGLSQVAAVNVSSGLRMPGERRGYIHLNVRRGDVHSGRIVIVFEPNPAVPDGSIAFDEGGVCDFGGYVDGELGRISVPEGRIVKVEFDAGEDPWMRADAADGAWRILGGWRPNDPKADGRTQEGRIVISDADGSNAERYTVRRRNQGLPVVEIGGTWWCKYNLRGDARSFDDQISIQEDPASDAGLADHLVSCGDEELLQLLGDQYQGGNRHGLPLRHDGTSFYHEGMSASAQNFGTIEPSEMAPAGYRIPDYDDYAFFSGSNNYNLGGVGTRSYRNSAGEEISVRIMEREAAFLGNGYGTIAVYEFSHGGGCWVLCGLGHQWNTTPGNISRMMVLLATGGSSTSSWYMEGYAQSDRPGQNWFKYTAQNSTKTRTLRCIKTPVEYIY